MMTNSRIAILTGHSLLADGIISRLQEYPEALDLRVFDNKEPNVMADIKTFHPLAIILEESESQQFESCSLKQLLNILPSLIIIYLQLGQSSIQIIQSEQCPANRVRELVDIIQQSKNHFSYILTDTAKGLPVDQSLERGKEINVECAS